MFNGTVTVKLDGEKTHQRLVEWSSDRQWQWPLGPIFTGMSLQLVMSDDQRNSIFSKPQWESCHSPQNSEPAYTHWKVLPKQKNIHNEAGVVYIVRLVSLQKEVVAHTCTAMLCPQRNR